LTLYTRTRSNQLKFYDPRTDCKVNG
jgi:hypothetical protein